MEILNFASNVLVPEPLLWFPRTTSHISNVFVHECFKEKVTTLNSPSFTRSNSYPFVRKSFVLLSVQQFVARLKPLMCLPFCVGDECLAERVFRSSPLSLKVLLCPQSGPSIPVHLYRATVSLSEVPPKYPSDSDSEIPSSLRSYSTYSHLLQGPPPMADLFPDPDTITCH